MQGEKLLPYGIHETCPYPFTHGKYAWASNMDSIKFQFISLCKGCHQLPKSANLVYQSDYEIGSTTPSDEAMAKIMTLVMIKCLNLEKKKEKNKRLKAKV